MLCSQSKFISSLAGLRGIAALMVFHHHAVGKNLLPDLFNTGERGVMLFFCLSGFLLAELYLQRETNLGSICDFARNNSARFFRSLA